MINELLQWIAIVGVVVLVLAMYSSFGSSVLRNAGSVAEIAGPAIGTRVPPDLWALRADDDGLIMAFVSESCVGCGYLLAHLERDSDDPANRPVLVARDPSPGFLGRISETGCPVYVDDGTLWTQWTIAATPFLVYVSRDRRVVGKEVSHVIRQQIEEESV